MTNKNATYHRIIHHAGPIFAEKGFSQATGKAICAAAGINAAAINYHFGSIDGLYTAVLDQLAARLMDLDRLETAIDMQDDPVAKLSILMEPIVQMLAHDSELGWMARLAGHEIVSCSMKSPTLDEKLERLGVVVTNVVQCVSRLPSDDARIPLLSGSFLGCLQWLFMVDRDLLNRMFPGIEFTAENKENLRSNILSFALGGLRGFSPKEA